MPRARLLQHGLNGYNELRHLRCRFPKMRVDDVLSFKQFDLDAALPGYVSFLAASDDPTVILDAPVKQDMECHASLLLPHTELPMAISAPLKVLLCGLVYGIRMKTPGVGPRTAPG